MWLQIFFNEASRVWVEYGPDLPKVIAQVSIHKLVLSVCWIFESFQYNRNEEPQENSGYDEGIWKKEGLGGLSISAAKWLAYLI